MGSSGYGSHGSNGSHEQLVSISSSSESNGNLTGGITAEETGKAKPPRTFQEICKGVHMQKNQDSQVCLRSPSSSPLPSKPEQKKTTDSEFNFLVPLCDHFNSLQGACLLCVLVIFVTLYRKPGQSITRVGYTDTHLSV